MFSFFSTQERKKEVAYSMATGNLQLMQEFSLEVQVYQCLTISSFRSEFTWCTCTVGKTKIPLNFSVAIGNGKLMHVCFPKHSRMGTARNEIR